MRSKKLLSLILVASMCCSSLLGACGAKDPAQEKPAEGEKPADTATAEAPAEAADEKLAAVQELVYVYNSDPTTMDPAFSNTVPDQKAQSPVYEGLTKRVQGEGGILVDSPAAAESWEVSEDKTVYTFHLRKGAKWSDGTPVTAQDFDYSWKRVFDPKTASPQAWLLQSIIKNGDECMDGKLPMDQLGCRAVDESTFEVTLKEPNVTFITLSGYNFVKPVQKAKIDEFGSQYGSTVDRIVGNGPYIMASWEPGSEYTFKPNPEYWDAANVKLTKLTIKIIQETSTVAQALIANEVDIAGLNDPDWNDPVEQTGYYNVTEQAKMEMEFFLFNCADPILKNPKIRLALSMAWDRDKYNNEVNNGNRIPTYCMTPPITVVGDKLYSERVGDKQEVLKDLMVKYPDPKALLLEGMKEEGLGEDPSKIDIHFYTRGVNEYCKKSAEWHKQAIETTLGINFIIEMTEWNILYDLIDAGKFQMAEAGWNADVGLEPNEFLDLFEYKDGYYGQTRSRWSGPKAEEYSKLFYEVKAETDNDKKAQLYLQMDQILEEDAPISPIYATKSRSIVGKYVHGFETHPLITPDFAHVYLTER